MTFLERYQLAETWQDKCLVMEIYHLAMTTRSKNWTITRTAESFGVSIGLVSENLRLALAIHVNPKMLECETRQDAIRKLNGNYRRINGDDL